MNLCFQAKEQGFNEHKAEIEIECPYTDCEWSEKGKKGSIQKSNLIKHLGIYHKLLDVCYEECKEQPPPPSPKSVSPEPPKKKMSLSDYKKKRTETNQNDAPKFPTELEKEYEILNEEVEKVDGKEKKLDQEMNDAYVETCRFCLEKFPLEEIDRHLVDHFLPELNLFATLIEPSMVEACGKCPPQLDLYHMALEHGWLEKTLSCLRHQDIEAKKKEFKPKKDTEEGSNEKEYCNWCVEGYDTDKY